MKKIHKTLAIGALVVGTATILGTSQASAFWGEDLINSWKAKGTDRPELTTEQQAFRDERLAGMGERMGGRHGNMEENHEAMLEVFKNGDYQGWLALMGDRPVAQDISEGEFARFTEMHNFRIAGDHEAAQEIAEELGLPEMRARHREEMGGEGFEGAGQGQGQRQGQGMKEGSAQGGGRMSR